ncbi:hypothetical protein AMJ85_07030 [candidate division BRC1 bacterium SM23_51]|nr:MAG: hypothetical protein AMJ85_07030 [candidate division BRC1 bacterium SM23_51]
MAWKERTGSKNRSKVGAASVLALAAAIVVGAGFCAAWAESASAPSLQERLESATSGTVVNVAAGTFAGPLRVPPGVTVRGAGSGRTIIRAPANTKVTVALSSGAKLEKVRVEGGQIGVESAGAANVRVSDAYVTSTGQTGLRLTDTTAEIRNAIIEGDKSEQMEGGISLSGGQVRVENSIVRGWDDGLIFDSDNPTRLWLTRCVLTENDDAVDLESTWAVISHCSFARNRDDAVDVDGDSSCTVVACAIEDSRDDGIEIRLERKTYVDIRDCSISRSGEDGIEVIDTPHSQGPFSNHVLIERCRIGESARYGIGLSDQKTEEANPAIRFPVRWRNVAFHANKKGDVAPHKAE